MKNIAVFVSGGGTNLGALIKAQNDGIIKNGRITLVVSSSEKAYALKRAEDANIETAVVSRKNYGGGSCRGNRSEYRSGRRAGDSCFPWRVRF